MGIKKKLGQVPQAVSDAVLGPDLTGMDDDQLAAHRAQAAAAAAPAATPTSLPRSVKALPSPGAPVPSEVPHDLIKSLNITFIPIPIIIAIIAVRNNIIAKIRRLLSLVTAAY